MKLLHTADWHVGRTLRGRSRTDEHTAVLAEIADIARREAVDLVIIAGDLFDTAAPAPESERIVYRALLDLVETGAHVIVIAGNHDNAFRLAAVRPLLDLTRVRTIALPSRADEGGVIDVALRSGESVRIAALPFVTQRGVIKAEQLMKLDEDERVQAYAERCKKIVEHLCAGFDSACINIVVAHLTVAGGRRGGGERDAHTIFEYEVPAQIFPAGAHYVALGHLHRTQEVAGACPIWYSGSALQLDFGEGDNEPGVVLVEAGPRRRAKCRTVPLASGRRLRTVRGTIANLQARVGSLGEDYLRVVVEGPTRAGLADEVREMFPNAVDVVLGSARAEGDPAGGWSFDQVHRSPPELFGEYLADHEIEDAAMTALFRELWAEVTTAEAEGVS
jgi:exonuclease SbcD